MVTDFQSGRSNRKTWVQRPLLLLSSSAVVYALFLVIMDNRISGIRPSDEKGDKALQSDR